jgi:glycosyltransferase involved in cell wall biosynthesis
MRICIVGKFPPVQGGVSMRTYWNAHRLAAHGHEVHVVTNAKEVSAPFRMLMRADDWRRCEATYGTGSVTVHWTDPVGPMQFYIPMANPFVSKLAGTAARIHSACPFDVVLSHYMEPYGVAGHLIAEITGVPHVVRMAGSDAGRLWPQPQFEFLYDHILRCAAAVIASGATADRAVSHGVAPERIAVSGGFLVPEELFTPKGAALDLTKLRMQVAADPASSDQLWGEFAGDRPYFGVCGKLGDEKGTFALLAALERLKRMGIEVGLVALAHGETDVENRFRTTALELGVTDRILQIPFMPHWRIPEFLRGCLAVCCLEQDFSIPQHRPMIPREVLLCGTCLVGSTEVIRKLPFYERLPHGYGCVAVENVDDVDTLAVRLAAIAHEPELAAAVGARGSSFARELQRDSTTARALETILAAAAAREPIPSIVRWFSSNDSIPASGVTPTPRKLFTSGRSQNNPESLAQNEPIFRLPAEGRDAGEQDVFIDARTIYASSATLTKEEVIAIAERRADQAYMGLKSCDPLFRLRVGRWAMSDTALGSLLPIRNPRLRILKFDSAVPRIPGERSGARTAEIPQDGSSYVVVFGESAEGRREPLLVDGITATILRWSDGTRTATTIARDLNPQSDAISSNLKWIEHLFVLNLIGLDEASGAMVDVGSALHPMAYR